MAGVGKQKRRTDGASSRRRSDREVGSQAIGRVAIAFLLSVVVGIPALGAVSGRFGLEFAVRRIPSTLTGDIVLDTPTEYAELEFAVASDLNVRVDSGFASLLVDATVNMAGAEHMVIMGDLPIKDLSLYGIVIDKLRFVPEVWVATPFGSVTDVNNLSNSTVIPPGSALFATGRISTTCTIGGFTVKHVAMLQDINFPKPGASYTPPDTYTASDQDFAVGSLLYTSWRSQAGYYANMTLGLNAGQSGTSVKGYSAAGTVDPGNWFVSGSIGGIKLGEFTRGADWIADPQIGLSFVASTTQTMSGTVGFSARVYGMAIGASLGVFSNAGAFSGISLSGTAGCFHFALGLDELKLTSLSARFSTPLDLGTMRGSFTTSVTGLEKGLTGLSMRLSLTQGLFSAGTSVSFADSSYGFRFASLATQLTYRLSPGTIALQAIFSRNGLTRAALTTGVAF